MVFKRLSWMLVFPIALLLCINGGNAVYAQRTRIMSVTEQRAREQDAENRQRENEARQLQSQIFNRAEELYKNKRFEEAYVLYRRVINISYPYWDLGSVRRPVRPKGRAGEGQAPATSQTRRKLVTALNTRAEERIRSMRDELRDAAFVEAFGDAQAMHDDGNLGPAYAALHALSTAQGVTDATRKKYERQINTMIQNIEKEANRLINELKNSVDARDREKARAFNREFRLKFDFFPQHPVISAQFRDLVTSPEFTELIREDIAAELLQKAREAFENNDLETAVEIFNNLVNFYLDTEAGKEAQTDLETIYGDQDLQRSLANEQARRLSEVWIRQAVNFTANRRYDEARKLYNRILEYFPDTDYANQAVKALADIDALEKLEAH